MDRRLVMTVSLGVLLAGCVRPAARSTYDPFSLPKLPPAPTTQPDANLSSAMTLNAPSVVSDVLPAEISVTVDRSIADQVKQVRLSGSSAHTTKAAPTWSMTGPVQVTADGTGVARLTGPLAMGVYTGLPSGYSLLKAEGLDADGKVIASIRKPVVNVGNVVSRSITQVQAAGLPMLAQHDPYRANEWLGAAAAIDRLRSAIAHEQVADVGRLVHEVQTRTQILQRANQPAIDRTHLHDLLLLGYRPEAGIIVNYPSADTALVTFNCGSVPMANVVVQQFASEDEARAELDTKLTDVPSRELDQFRGRSKLSTTWTATEPVDPATLDLHENLFIVDAANKTVVGVVSPDMVSNLQVDAVVISPRAHALPAKAAAFYADEHSVPVMQPDNLAGARRVLVAGDVRNDPTLANAKYTRFATLQGATQLYVVDGRRLLHAVAPTGDAALLAVRMVQQAQDGQPVGEDQVDWLRREVVRGIDRTIKAESTPMVCGDMNLHSVYPATAASPAGRVLEAMYGLQDFSGVSGQEAAIAEQAKSQLLDAGVKYPLIVNDTANVAASPVRTVIFTPNTTPDVLVTTLTKGDAVAVVPESQQLFVGQPQWQRRALSSLADGGKLKDAKAQRIGTMLRSANIAKLLGAGETSPATKEAMAK